MPFSPPSCLRASRGSASRPAFTLVELIVVIGIISILVISVLPILGTLYRDTQGADAANRLQGLLKSARMRAVGGLESGLFFFIEPGTNTQKIVFIQADPPDYTDLSPTQNSPDIGADDSPNTNDDVTEQCAVDRFRVLEENVFTLPPPFRVAPLRVLDEASGGWSDVELANNDYTDGGVVFTEDGPQNHRNFFTIVFSPKGRLVVNRSVLVHDPVPVRDDHFKPGKGTVTLLNVDAATNYQPNDNATASSNSISAKLGCPELPSMIVAEDGGQTAALNFPSVAGLLVYDDSIFGEYPDSDDTDSAVVDKRDFLRERGQPIYISPQTGAIIRGPVGEDST